MKLKLSKFKGEPVFCAISLLLFFFMMCFNLTHSALWGDEWVEFYYSQETIRDGSLYEKIVSTLQPPLYNFIMHFWLKISQSLWWFRFFNVLAGFAGGIAVYLAIRKLTNYKVACVSVVIMSLTYQWIYCIQEASEYAIMLVFICLALCFFVYCMDKFSYFKMACFILSAVLALYSQYGAVFIVLPLLAIFFFMVVGDKTVDKKRKIIVTASYIFSFLAFAVPLYVFFLKAQLALNEISGAAVPVNAELFKELPFAFGSIIGYFFNVSSDGVWGVLSKCAGIIIIVISICAFRCKIGKTQKVLIAVLWIAYISHYMLVKLQIYAMIHPGLSGGFLCRYSYFYIPLLAVVFPAMFYAFGVNYSGKVFMVIKCACALVLAVTVLFSGIATLKNWHKSYDDIFTKIWMENEGWNDLTILYGCSPYGFFYYVPLQEGYQQSYLMNVTAQVDYNELPDRFWVWRTNWQGDIWYETVDEARRQGYTVTVYVEDGYAGQLAYCYKE